MSENKNIQNEEELWDLLSSPASAETKADAPKPEAKAQKPQSAPRADAPKSGKKIDGFFVACMAGVAAVSVAATVLCTSLFGGSTGAGATNGPVQGGSAQSGTDTSYAAELEQENAELRSQLEQQREQIKDLQSDLITLMGSEEFFATASTDPSENNEVLDAQKQALETFAQIQEAYADFDRERLEELIVQMNDQLDYLTPEALSSYYTILEYVEQPSNG